MAGTSSQRKPHRHRGAHLPGGRPGLGCQDDGSDAAPPPRPPPGFVVASAGEALSRLSGPWEAIALDPPRTGAAEAIEGIARAAQSLIVYVSRDPATLARDAARLVAAGYRATDAWPLDVRPQTAHIEVVLRLTRIADAPK